MGTRSVATTLQKRSNRWAKAVPGDSLGIGTANVVEVAEMLRQGLPYEALGRLEECCGLPLESILAVARIPRRALARRKARRRFSAEESERLYRLALVFEKSVELFEGDAAAARNWLTTPNEALVDQPPLKMIETEIGAREVEDLIGRLEHGVFA